MTTALAQNNIGRLSTEQYVQLISEAVCFSRLAYLTWSDDLNGFKPFISNDVFVTPFYNEEADISFLFKRCFINGKDIYRINSNFPMWAQTLLKNIVFRSGFTIDERTIKEVINQIPSEWIAD